MFATGRESRRFGRESMANYLVTGAAGFIASKVAELLAAEGHQITGIDDLNDAYVLFFSLFQWILPNYSMNSSGRCSNWFTTAGENWGRVKAL